MRPKLYEKQRMKIEGTIYQETRNGETLLQGDKMISSTMKMWPLDVYLLSCLIIYVACNKTTCWPLSYDLLKSCNIFLFLKIIKLFFCSMTTTK